MVRAQVHSTKHYVQYPFNDIAASVVETNFIAIATDVLDKNLNADVEEGNSIKAVFLEMWLQNASNDSTFIATLSKNPENGSGPTFVDMADLHNYVNKKNIFWTSEGLASNDGVSGPVNIIRQFIKIPKSKQRFGLGDTLSLNISNVSTGVLHRCGFSTYKEYS